MNIAVHGIGRNEGDPPRTRPKETKRKTRSLFFFVLRRPVAVGAQWFRDELSKEDCMPEEVLLLLFNHVDPIYEQHSLVLKELEHRLAAWEGRANNGLNAKTVDPAVHRLGDLLLKITAKLEVRFPISVDEE